MRHESKCCANVFVQVEQFEIWLQMQGKYLNLGNANFEYFHVYCGIIIVLVVFFCEIVVQESFCAEIVQIN